MQNKKHNTINEKINLTNIVNFNFLIIYAISLKLEKNKR